MGIDIPTLCHMQLHDLNIENKPGGCRICVVEVHGRRNLAPARASPNVTTDGSHTHPYSQGIECPQDSDGTHPLGPPEGLPHMPQVGSLRPAEHGQQTWHPGDPGYQEIAEMSTYRKDTSPSIIRDLDKCIMCRRCEMMCNDVQTVGALSAVNRGFMAVVAPAFEKNLEYSPCTYCGQCVAVCPTGALTEVDHTRDVLRAIVDPTKTVVVQTAPAVRAALGEEFGMKPGTLVTGKMVAALKELGFDYVFDTDFAADLTIMEEGTELLNGWQVT